MLNEYDKPAIPGIAHIFRSFIIIINIIKALYIPNKTSMIFKLDVCSMKILGTQGRFNKEIFHILYYD